MVAVPIGQGHSVGFYASRAGDGLPGEARGVNVLDVLPAGVDERGGRAWLTDKATSRATGATRRLPLLQFSDNQRERQLGEAISLVALAEGNGHAEAAAGGHGERPAPTARPTRSTSRTIPPRTPRRAAPTAGA